MSTKVSALLGFGKQSQSYRQGYMLIYLCSSKKENSVRRPAGGNQRTHIRNQTRSLVTKFSDFLPTIIIKVSAITLRTRRRGTRGGAQQKCKPSSGLQITHQILTNGKVVVLLQGKLADVGVNFKEVLEVRTKNLQASKSRTENFVSSVSSYSQPQLNPQQSASPLYNTPTKSRTPQPGYQNSNHDILNLDPSSSSMMQNGPQSDQQLMMMEEAQPTNTYINMRGEAIDMIERTINELGGVFGQLAAMVQEQGYVHYTTARGLRKPKPIYAVNKSKESTPTPKT